MIGDSTANAKFRLRFIAIDSRTVRIAVFSDACFAYDVDISSQLGYVIAIAYAESNASILHYTSFRNKRITRSVFAAEIFAIATALDIASAMRLAFNKLYGYPIPLAISAAGRASMMELLTQASLWKKPSHRSYAAASCVQNLINTRNHTCSIIGQPS